MTDSPLLLGLNPGQREAVLATSGPVLVIAGAGSGKTRALTYRIAYLIKECGISPHNILAVTFTNKAAGEMRERITKLLTEDIGGQRQTPTLNAEEASLFGSLDFGTPMGANGEPIPVDLPTIGTFHSLCVRILRKHIHLLDFENQFTIYDTSDQQILMKRLMEELKMNDKEVNPKAVLSHISNAKNRMVNPRQFAAMADSYFAEKVARLYGPYQDALKKNNALDFDDLLMKTLELLQKDASVLDYYQEKFKFVHVDEYQDTNHAQYLIAKMLSEKYRNLYVIGDHDQSIYSWRGANIQNILDFEKDYKDAKVITLEQNYRSTQRILDAAHSVIIKNKQRKEKKLWTEKTGGEMIRLWIAENERHEAELAAREILEAVRKHEKPDYRDFVILYRINAQSRTIEEVFMRYGIPYKIVGGIRFYERKEIKDIMAYLRVIANPSDSVSMLRIINTPQRNIGPKTIEKLQTYANIKDYTLFEAMQHVEEISDLPEAKMQSIEKFAKLIKHLQKLNEDTTAASLIKFVIDESGYKKFIDDGSQEAEARLENIAELISVATKYEKLEPGLSLNIFLEEVSLISDLDSLEEKENAVTMMTLHGAKGLEYPWVFILGMEEGLLPHSRAMLSPEELEEERRLFYVGCTRAMERLYLLHTKNRMFYGESQNAVPSQFLGDIPMELLITNSRRVGLDPRGHRTVLSADQIGRKEIPMEKELPEFSDGDRVVHKMWGEGVVISTLGGIVTVAFKNPTIGIKKLAISVAPLEKI
ncbi:UvrD-helicase domain-containing protein [Candidatus Gracilibacteria bacterium]|nr:UvrD-helicase domain-containing protein [Candidatus Gracilibacteria bacterium]